MVHVSLIQTCTPADPATAALRLLPLMRAAADRGAQFIVTPECANLMEARTEGKARKVVSEADDVLVKATRELAREAHVHILLGSVIVRAQDDDRHANRSLLIGPDGGIIARYDKIHLFDATPSDGRVYRESAGIRPGEHVVVAPSPFGGIGLSICYDVRFSALYRMMAQNGASIICVPAAFTVPTGKAHWEVLLRARAIETGAFVLAAAQGGAHEDGRVTYGHSMIVSPWGEVLARLDDDAEGFVDAELDLTTVERARSALPQLRHDRPLRLP